MKKLVLALTLFIGFQLTAQEKPQQVYSIAKEVKELSWYEKQAALWKKEIDKNNQYGDAWINYYNAARAMANVSRDNEATYQKYDQMKTQIISDVNKIMPNSFESNYLTYVNSGFSSDATPLKNAEKLQPYSPWIIDELMIYYHTQRNTQKFDEYATKMYELNEMPVAILNWGYNLLSELDENAVVFTAGDNDTYALWIIQGALNFRKDVTVLNYYIIQEDDFRERIIKELKYPDLGPLKTATTNEEMLVRNKQITDHFFLKGNRPTYVATTAYSCFPESYSDSLYLTGLAYLYSPQTFDNIGLIRRNYEKRYLLDYLKVTFSYNVGNEHAKQFNEMYLSSLINLYQDYEKTENYSKMLETESLLMKIAVESGKENEVIEFMTQNGSKPISFKSTTLDLKTLEKNMVKLNGKVFIDKYETTNEDYNKFLENLKLSGNTTLYETCVYDSTQWVKGKFLNLENEPMQNFYHWHPAYNGYPVVNITYEAAKAYCEWLTKQYNMQRKRTYTQVVFRLPTPEEWHLAAGSGDSKAKNPFNGPNVRDSKGCYLANIQTEPGKFFEDGGFQTVKVQSYQANKMGLYCTLGNVSEMTSVKGDALGGSWYNLYEECTFEKIQKYLEANPLTGFRVVMEIIEE